MQKSAMKAKVYIDGANIFYAQKHLGWFVNWKKLQTLLKGKFEILESRYYTGIKIDDGKMKKYLSYLNHIGYKTITKPLKIIKDRKGLVAYKSNCDIEIAIDMLLDVNDYDIAVVLSGDSDFVYLVKILQKQFQKKVWVISSKRTMSWEMKLSADKYIFLEELKNKLKR